MKKLAVCIHGQNNEDIKNVILKKYPEYKIIFFEEFDQDLFKSLWKLSVVKNDYELKNYEEFDICMAIMTSDIKIFETTPIVEIKKDTVYFHSGKKIDFNIIDIFLTNFYSDSITFNRVCECYHHKHLSRINKIRNSNLSEGALLFCHIKSLMLNTSCINYENSNLFIGSATIN